MRIPVIPLVVASALFMENLDATVLSVALPAISRDFATDPVHLKLALTSYMLSIAIFVPASGWVADRYGARRVFVLAMAVFMLGSVLCSLSQSLIALVSARVVQGLGGALMLPVGRLVVLRSVPRQALVGSLAWLTIPALVGPLVGPSVGGFIVTVASWPWIFWINVPVGLLGIACALRLLPEFRETPPGAFDTRGFLYSAIALSTLVAAAAMAGVGAGGAGLILGLAATGLLTGWLYVRHARSIDNPIIDLSLLTLATFRASIVGGSLFRIGVGATPFLLPLLLQIGLRFDPLTAGVLTTAAGLGAIAMKFVARPLLDTIGFRRVLAANGLLAAALLPLPVLFSADTSHILMAAALLVGGFVRSLQFTAVNALAYAEVDDKRISAASSFAAVAQQIGWSLGVSVAAIAIDISRGLRGDNLLTLSDFHWAFLVVTLLSAASVPFFLRLRADAGSELTGKPSKPVAAG